LAVAGEDDPGEVLAVGDGEPVGDGAGSAEAGTSLLKALRVIEKDRHRPLRPVRGQYRRRSGHDLDVEAQPLDELAPATPKQPRARVAGGSPVGALRDPGPEFLGREHADISDSREEFRAQPIEGRYEEPHRDVPGRLGEGSSTQALDLRKLQTGDHRRVLSNRAAQRGLGKGAVAIRGDYQQWVGRPAVALPPETPQVLDPRPPRRVCEANLQGIVAAAEEHRQRTKTRLR
jgi:hypothetical protein